MIKTLLIFLNFFLNSICVQSETNFKAALKCKDDSCQHQELTINDMHPFSMEVFYTNPETNHTCFMRDPKNEEYWARGGFSYHGNDFSGFFSRSGENYVIEQDGTKKSLVKYDLRLFFADPGKIVLFDQLDFQLPSHEFFEAESNSQQPAKAEALVLIDEYLEKKHASRKLAQQYVESVICLANGILQPLNISITPSKLYFIGPTHPYLTLFSSSIMTYYLGYNPLFQAPDFDVKILLTGLQKKDFTEDQGVLGVTVAGGACHDEAKTSAVSITDGNIYRTQQTVAHEFLHLMGIVHDYPPECTCSYIDSEGKKKSFYCIMSPGASYSYLFSDCTVNTLRENMKTSRTRCIYETTVTPQSKVTFLLDKKPSEEATFKSSESNVIFLVIIIVVLAVLLIGLLIKSYFQPIYNRINEKNLV